VVALVGLAEVGEDGVDDALFGLVVDLREA
jgi:hypothetical protein